jgi:hypothetical protein
MKELLEAYEVRKKYNQMDLLDSIKEFEEYSNQKVPKEAIDDFKFCGLINTDFFFSDWLNHYGLKNLLQLNDEQNGK